MRGTDAVGPEVVREAMAGRVDMMNARRRSRRSDGTKWISTVSSKTIHAYTLTESTEKRVKGPATTTVL